jgi:hypothetical protein
MAFSVARCLVNYQRHGGYSSVGRAPDCDSGCHGFKSHYPPQFKLVPAPDDMTLLMQRLRTLQLRLNAVDPGAVKNANERLLAWRSAAGDIKGAENRRRLLQIYVTGSANDLVKDIRGALQSRFLPKLDQSFRSLLPAVQSRAEAVSGMRMLEIEDSCSPRLKALDRIAASADAQLTDVQAVCLDAYQKLADINDRMDSTWSDESLENIGGWRNAMAKVRTEKEAAEKTPMESFREEAYSQDDDGNPEEPTSTRLTCPMCQQKTGKRQPRTGLMEDFAGMFGIAPFRCGRCMVRYYRFRPHRKRQR